MIGNMLIISMDSPLNTLATAEFVVVSCTIDEFVVVSCTVDEFVVVSCTVVGEGGEPVTVGDDDKFDDAVGVLVINFDVVGLVVELDAACDDGDVAGGVCVVFLVVDVCDVGADGAAVFKVVEAVEAVVIAAAAGGAGGAAADCTTISITY